MPKTKKKPQTPIANMETSSEERPKCQGVLILLIKFPEQEELKTIEGKVIDQKND